MHLTDQITSAADLVWAETHDLMTGQITTYETWPTPGFHGAIRCVLVGRDGGDDLMPVYQYSAHVGNRMTSDQAYALATAKQGVYDGLCLLSMSGEQGDE